MPRGWSSLVMGRLRKLLSLSWSDRWLLVQVALLLAGIRLGLILLPFRRLWGVLERLGRDSG